MAIFETKPWVNPFGKMSIFRLFERLYFYSLERRFFVLEYRKRDFPGLYCLKKNFGKMIILGPKPWVNSFEKMAIFRPKPWVNYLGKMFIFGLFELLVL